MSSNLRGPQQRKFTVEHSGQWHESEYLYLDGVAHVYTIDADGMKRVRFPGGGHCRLPAVIDRVTCMPSLTRIRGNRTHVDQDSSLIHPAEMST